MSNADWPWYHANTEDSSWSGPYETKDEAIASGNVEWGGDSFYVAQAINPPVMLSDWVSVEILLEHAEGSIFDNDRADYEWDDQIFTCSPEQERDLIARVKTACDEWQAAHGLSFKCNTFERMTGPEKIIPPAAQE